MVTARDVKRQWSLSASLVIQYTQRHIEGAAISFFIARLTMAVSATKLPLGTQNWRLGFLAKK